MPTPVPGGGEDPKPTQPTSHRRPDLKPPRKNRSWYWIAIGVVLGVTVTTLIGVGLGIWQLATPDQPVSAPAQTPQYGADVQEEPPPNTLPDGIYRIGPQMASGIWRSDGAMAPGEECRWQLLDGTGAEIGNGQARYRESQTVNVIGRAATFKSEGCRTWERAGS